jgi:hypothetical protein
MGLLHSDGPCFTHRDKEVELYSCISINPGAPQRWVHVTFLSSPVYKHLESKQFEDVEMIKCNARQQLLEIPTTEYDRCFQDEPMESV